MPHTAGDKLGPYEILTLLGEGGMGQVWKARDSRLDRIVAIKFSKGEFSKRFEREARAIAALNHPNICILHDIGPDYLVMEFIDGTPIQGPLPLDQALRYALQICNALDAAHQKSITHRDLKPGNILVAASGVKLLDFRLAKVGATVDPTSDVEQTMSLSLTEAGAILGTAAYMSPEQAKGEPVDARSDVFSFGLVLYEMLSGRRAFARNSAVETMAGIIRDEPAPLQAPPNVSAIVNGCLCKLPARRFQAMAEVRTALEQAMGVCAGGGVIEMIVDPPASSRGLRRRWLTPAVVLVLAVLAAAGWWTRARWIGPQLPASRQLVILPFENLSRDPLDQAFCDGLVELLTSSLTQMERFHSVLWVIPSSDVRRLKLQSVGDARKAFPVNLAVTGSLQSDGDQILVVVNLSDAANMRQIGSQIVPVRRADRSQLITRLNSELLRLLGLSGGEPAGGAPRPITPSAYEAYVQGKGFLLRSEIPANLNRAIELLEQSFAQDQKFAASQATLADAYLRRYQATKNREWLAKADQMVQRSLALDPREPQVHITLGRLYRTMGEPGKAVTEYQKAIAMDDLNVAAYTNLAIAYSDARRPADAENTYLQAVRIRPSYWPAYSNLGIFYMQRGDYGKAVEPLSLVVKLAPDYVEGHTNLGVLYYNMNRFDEALEELGKSLSTRPTSLALSNRGTVFFFKGDFARARDDFRRAIELEDNNPLFWGNLADALTQIPGSQAESREAYLRAIALSHEQLAVNPNNATLVGRLAFFLARTSNCIEARSLMKKSLRLAPDRVPLIFRAAKVAEACHDRQSALTYLGTAIGKGYPRREVELDPDLRALRQSPAYAAMGSRSTGR